ncbi:SAM-dependent methyltransferase [Mitsuokella sp. AF21-1AC]|uniref:SAM-dependent methyltransferase n=1 Tax=Mitsuokella sp. AF21-1AC TaxID=2292235 RepID=UPI000E4FAF37|nr:SAM-dependent methyltransferase [Mitsuokella sp. AF21-1AC]RGS72363.1 tetrapyrrole methylase [Mitsuokella sp. AF21-1AC]
MSKITVVGLGPGRPGLITMESWQLMKEAQHLILRTRIHPTVAALEKEGLSFATYDDFYQEAPDFETLYRTIADDLMQRARKMGNLVYAVPGSPLVAERTVVLLRELAAGSDVEVEILPGMSFVEVLYTRLGIDPIDGLTILDAEDVGTLTGCPAQSLVITQIYDSIIASDTKLMLMELYPDEYEVTYIHNLALPDESIRRIPLYELDRQHDVDHLTSLFVPAPQE